jgi:hypothetical protein
MLKAASELFQNNVAMIWQPLANVVRMGPTQTEFNSFILRAQEIPTNVRRSFNS